MKSLQRFVRYQTKVSHSILCRLYSLKLSSTSSLPPWQIPVECFRIYITPLLIKSDIDPADVRSHRAISNLSVVFKLLERLQPACRAGYSIETVVLKVFIRHPALRPSRRLDVSIGVAGSVCDLRRDGSRYPHSVTEDFMVCLVW